MEAMQRRLESLERVRSRKSPSNRATMIPAPGSKNSRPDLPEWRRPKLPRLQP